MSLKSITDVMAREYRIPASRMYQMVQFYHELLAQDLKMDGKVRLPHLGVLKTKERSAREGTNPATGKKIYIRERKAVGFRPAKDLLRFINDLDKLGKDDEED
jgi:nucleoid DNA-binding protein